MFRLCFGDFFVPKQAQENALHPGTSGGGTGPGGLPPASLHHAANDKRHISHADVPFALARLKGLEPLTYWFVASHSIQLSYKRNFSVPI